MDRSSAGAPEPCICDDSATSDPSGTHEPDEAEVARLTVERADLIALLVRLSVAGLDAARSAAEAVRSAAERPGAPHHRSDLDDTLGGVDERVSELRAAAGGIPDRFLAEFGKEFGKEFGESCGEADKELNMARKAIEDGDDLGKVDLAALVAYLEKALDILKRA